MSEYFLIFLIFISEVLFPTVFTFFLSGAFAMGILFLFPKWGIMDNPKKYGYKRNPIPHPGGVAPVLAFLVSLLVFFPKNEKYFGFFCALSLIALVSFWDDRKGLPVAFRLAVHILAGLLVVFSGLQIEYLGNPFGDTWFLPDFFVFLPGIITVAWLVGFSNVLNWLDGVPGLSAGSAMSAGIFLGMLSLTPLVSQPEVAKLSLVFAASAGGFFFFNIPPPKMLLGDTGAMVFGFIIASLSVFSGGKMATVFIVLAIPMLDAVYVVLRRIFAKRNPFSGRDNLHLHDRLASFGFSGREILLFFLSLSVLLGWLSLQLETMGKMILIFSTGFIFLLFSFLLEKMHAHKKFPKENGKRT